MKLVAYYRVSTKRQGRSGLGLAAQQSAVQAYADGRGNVIAEYTEVETGKRPIGRNWRKPWHMPARQGRNW